MVITQVKSIMEKLKVCSLAEGRELRDPCGSVCRTHRRKTTTYKTHTNLHFSLSSLLSQLFRWNQSLSSIIDVTFTKSLADLICVSDKYVMCELGSSSRSYGVFSMRIIVYVVLAEFYIPTASLQKQTTVQKFAVITFTLDFNKL